MPADFRPGDAANDNACTGTQSNEQILAATGTDGIVDVGAQKPKLTVIERGAADPNTPRATAGSGEGPASGAPQGGGASKEVGSGTARLKLVRVRSTSADTVRSRYLRVRYRRPPTTNWPS